MAITPSEWMQLLRKVFLFSTFTGSQLTMLSKRMTLVSFPKGAVLFHEHDPGDALYIIVSGTVRILKSKSDTNNTENVTLAFLNRGDVLGEMAILAGEPRTNTAVVDSTAELLVLYKRDFDQLVEKNPSMAVHLSRVLSSRLASMNRTGGVITQAAQIITLVPLLPVQDQVVFSVNLTLSLVEQTHSKVLLIVVDEGGHHIARSLGLENTPLTETEVKEGALQDLHKINNKIMVHQSGFELLEIDSKVFVNTINQVVYSFFSLIKENYDLCLIVLPEGLHGPAKAMLQECERLLVVGGPQSMPESFSELPKLEAAVTPGKKPEKIWLSYNPQTLVPEFVPDVRVDWDIEWGRRFMSQGSPFFALKEIKGQRQMDRLARKLARLSIGFAMGSGAAFGYALIGMLRVMEREGVFPDIISGTSMGALIGAFYAAGKGPEELEQIACSIGRKQLWAMADPILPRTGLIRGNGVLNFLRQHLGDKTFKDLYLPFACVATDIQTGKEIVLDQGNVAEAVRGSLSLPFFFQPYYSDGRYLVDGGLVNPVPTSIIVAQGANILLSANLTSKAAERRVPAVIGWWRRRMPSIMRGPSIAETMIKTIYIMQYEISQARSEISHVVMNIKSHDLLWWDLDRAREMIRMGEASAEEAIQKIKSLLPFFTDSCKIRLNRKGRKNY